MTEADLPKPAPAPAGTIQVVDYPYADDDEPGPDDARVAGDRASSTRPSARCSALFLDAFAGDESTPLYKKLIDSKTRVDGSRRERRVVVRRRPTRASRSTSGSPA